MALAQPKLGRVVYGQGSIDPFFAAGYVALKRGYFGEAGLEVEYLNSQSGPRTNQLLAAGQIVFGATAATAAPALTLAGKPATLVFGFDRKLTYANVIVRREDYDSGKIKSLKDLAGKRVGATQPQSSTWLMALYLMQKAGVADKVDIRPLGDLATMLGALKTGSVSASMATMSMMEQARQEGWGVPIFDATTEASWNEFMGGDVPGIAALTLADTIQNAPKRCRPSSARWSRRRISSAPMTPPPSPRRSTTTISAPSPRAPSRKRWASTSRPCSCRTTSSPRTPTSA